MSPKLILLEAMIRSFWF